jgi:amino acid transporter
MSPVPEEGTGADAAPVVRRPRKRPAYESAAGLIAPTAYDPDMRRPLSTAAGACLVLLRVAAGVIVLASLAIGWDEILADPGTVISGFDPTPEGGRAALWFVLAAGATVLAVQALLAIFVYRGHNWARVIVMLFAVISISSSFVAWWAQGQEITLTGTFLSLSLDILVLLALSSRSAAAYARRKERW